MRLKKRYFWRVFLIAICVGIIIMAALVAQSYYRLEIQNFTSKDNQKHSYYIDSCLTIEQVLDMLEEDYDIGSRRDFMLHAKLMHFNYPEPGYYVFDSVISNRKVIERLRIGDQTPVEITWKNNIRKPEHLAGQIAQTLRMDSATLLNYMQDSLFLAGYGLNKENSRCLFIPNTYQVLWTITPEQLFDRMQTEFDKFWTPERLEKAENQGITPLEASILASIVEDESQKKYDQDTVASLYLNRLHNGWLLQADPTVIYANDMIGTQRVLNRHLKIDHPYNTYVYKGLPPGPLRCPLPQTIDVVLNAPKTKYFYMCANPSLDGRHKFTRNLNEHNRAAHEYHEMMNQRAAQKRAEEQLAKQLAEQQAAEQAAEAQTAQHTEEQ